MIKIVAIRCHILRLKCTGPRRGAHTQRSLDPLTRFEGVLILREGKGMGEGKGRRGEERGKGKEGEGEGGERGEGEG